MCMYILNLRVILLLPIVHLLVFFKLDVHVHEIEDVHAMRCENN